MSQKEVKNELSPEQEAERQRKHKQKKLDTLAFIEYQEKGCPNIVQARFMKEIGRLVHHENNPKLASLMSSPKSRDTVAWQKAELFCIAYLRRYKMEETLRAIKSEGGAVPKETGFKKSSDLERFYKKLMITTNAIKDKTFKERVSEFNEEMRNEIIKGSKLKSDTSEHSNKENSK